MAKVSYSNLVATRLRTKINLPWSRYYFLTCYWFEKNVLHWSQFSFSELKRRLDDDKTPLPKRLCLAKNVVQSHHFPTAPKERIVAEWLHNLTEKNKLSSDELKNVLDWLSAVDDLTSELKSKLVQVCLSYF